MKTPTTRDVDADMQLGDDESAESGNSDGRHWGMPNRYTLFSVMATWHPRAENCPPSPMKIVCGIPDGSVRGDSAVTRLKPQSFRYLSATSAIPFDAELCRSSACADAPSMPRNSARGRCNGHRRRQIPAPTDRSPPPIVAAG